MLALPFTRLALNVTPQFLVAATWMILIVSTCAVLLLFYMLSRKAASQVGVLFYLIPVMTVVLDYIVFGNTISWVTLFGALVIVVAVRRFSQVHCRK